MDMLSKHLSLLENGIAMQESFRLQLQQLIGGQIDLQNSLHQQQQNHHVHGLPPLQLESIDQPLHTHSGEHVTSSNAQQQDSPDGTTQVCIYVWV